MSDYIQPFRPSWAVVGSGSPVSAQRSINVDFPAFRCDGGDVPEYGVIEVTDCELQPRGGPLMLAQRPEETGEDRYKWFLNTGVKVPSGEVGSCTRSGVLLGRMTEPDATDAAGGALEFGQWFIADPDQPYTLKRTFVPPAGWAFHYLGGFEPTIRSTVGVGLFQYLPVACNIVYGILTEDLDGISDGDRWETDSNTAEARAMKRNYDDEDFDLLDETFEVVNRTNVSFTRNTRFGAQRAVGEWVITFVGC